MKTSHILTICMASACIGCVQKTDKAPTEERVYTELQTGDNVVTTEKVELKDFNFELVSNGRIDASQYADLTFTTQGTIEHIYVKNGDAVAKGQAIASLNMYELRHAEKQNKISMEQADLQLKDILIGQGYSPKDFSKIPAEILKLAMIKSGYERCKSDCEMTQYNIEHATLRAPFAGKVANLTGKTHNTVSVGTPFCRIVGTSGMDVEFSVLESELHIIKIGEEINVRPYSNEEHATLGHISEINPIVGDNGLVKVKARLDNAGNLISGMNVRVSVRKRLKQQIVVPKTAIVQRSGRQVVFTLEDGKASWNYVQTGVENMNCYTITEGLNPGMEIIVTGNRNLSHGSPVTLIDKKR